MNPLDILHRTPKTNCGECGHPTCLAFAAAVLKAGEEVNKCPFINAKDLVLDILPKSDIANLSREKDLALVAHLKGKISQINFKTVADALGAGLETDKNSDGALGFCFFFR